jgi:hypothetical protein
MLVSESNKGYTWLTCLTIGGGSVWHRVIHGKPAIDSATSRRYIGITR